jgi:hypothetical protein
MVKGEEEREALTSSPPLERFGPPHLFRAASVVMREWSKED